MNRHQPNPPRRQQAGAAAAAAAASNSLQGSDWFAGAPASQVLITFSVVLYMAIRNDASSSWQLDSIALINASTTQATTSSATATAFYRYLTSKGTFLSTGEVVVGTSLQYYLYRRYERELGTRKFVALFVWVHILGILLEVFMVYVIMMRNRVYDMSSPALQWHYAGPYLFMGALFMLFHLHAPRIHPRFVSALGFYFSEKTLYYAWFFYLIGSSGLWRTLLPSALGALTTIVYLFVVPNLDVPNRLVQTVQPWFERIGLVSVATPIRIGGGIAAAAAAAAPRGVGPGTGTGGAMAGHAAAAAAQHQDNHDAAAAAAANSMMDQFVIPMPEPDASAVEQLTAMGFPQAEVMEALRQSHNNVEHAANRLLSGG